MPLSALTSWQDLTGNAQFVIDAQNTIWLVSNTDLDGVFQVCSSVDYGGTFQLVARYAFPTTNPGFDPAVCLDTDGSTLHIVGTRRNADATDDVVKFPFSAPSNLIGPTVIAQGGRVGSDYDVVALATSLSVYVLASLVDAVGYPGESLVGFPVSSDVVGTAELLIQSPLRGGSNLTFGTVSLLSPEGTVIEAYVGSHPKQFLFKDSAVQIALWTRTGTTWTGPAALYSFNARYVDDRLTLIADGDRRYLSQCFYSQDRKGLSSNLSLGYSDGSAWSFTTLTGVHTSSLVEPVVMVCDDHSAKLACIKRDFCQAGTDGLVQIFDLDTSVWGLTPTARFKPGLRASYLRGTQQLLPAVMSWGLVASSSTFQFLSGYDSPPVAELTPLSLVAHRDFEYTLSAAASYDANQDTLAFTWANNAPEQVQIQTATGVASLFVPNSQGPAEVGFSVSVVVDDLDAEGSPKHPPVAIASVQVVDGVLTVTLAEDAPNYFLLSTPLKLYGLASAVSLNEQSLLLASKSGSTMVFSPADPPLAGYPQDDEVGYVVCAQQRQVCSIEVPFLPAPTIASYGPIAAERNQLVALTPVITQPDPDTPLTYSWSQIQGTPVVVEGTDQPVLTLRTNGVDLLGEALVFSLEVNDQVNTPVSAAVTVDVAAATFTRDTAPLSRMLWTTDGSVCATLAQRNTNQVWSAPVASALYSDFTAVKRVNSEHGRERCVLISPSSALVYGVAPGNMFLRQVYPNNGEAVVDALHTEQDETGLLTSGDWLLRYSTTPLIYSDDSDVALNLGSLSSLDTFRYVTCTTSYQGSRVLILACARGLCLVQVRDVDWFVQDVLDVTAALLYGAADVLWVRSQGVTSLYTGTLFIGCQNPVTLETYETYLDLSSRQILGTYDSANLRNRYVYTGEVLFEETTSGGVVATPQLNNVVLAGANVTLNWTHLSSADINGYQIQFSSNGVLFVDWVTTSDGLVQSYTGVWAGGRFFRLRALTAEGYSPFSNVQQAMVVALQYYVDPVGGDDSNSGTSMDAAWLTTGQADSVALNEGDAVWYLLGGTWYLYRRLNMTADELELAADLVDTPANLF